MLKGTTKIIRDDGQAETIRQQLATPRSTPNRNVAPLRSSPNIQPGSVTSLSHSSTQSYVTPVSTPNRNSAQLINSPNARFLSSVSSNSKASGYFSPNSNQEVSIVASRSAVRDGCVNNKSDTFSQQQSLKAHKTFSALPRSSSEPSASFIRGQKIDALFDIPLPTSGAQALPVISTLTRVSNPTASSKGFSSPKIYSPQHHEAPIVKSPDWLTPYPNTSIDSRRSPPLSPLSNEQFLLNSFSSISIDTEEEKSRVQAQANSPSVSSSSSYPSSPRQIKEVVYQHSIDPRSPIKSKSRVPDCISFSRPTPSPLKRGATLPERFDETNVNGTPHSSVLFQSNLNSF
uniref:Uncharacterized protein n=1 Tax=Psilocybe cubensis TaxID=181762 RepID=A0A8H7Y7N4_PSICU